MSIQSHWRSTRICVCKIRVCVRVCVCNHPPRGVVFGRFLSLFLCQQHYEKTAELICIKFSGKVWSDHGTTWLNFGSIRMNGSSGQRSICLLSPAIAQRTGINKSVSFARWQQEAGFVVPRTAACFLLERYLQKLRTDFDDILSDWWAWPKDPIAFSSLWRCQLGKLPRLS